MTNITQGTGRQYTLSQKSKSPPSIFSYISKSSLLILIIQTVMDREFSYAKN